LSLQAAIEKLTRLIDIAINLSAQASYVEGQ